MDTTAWLRQTLAGTTITGITGRPYTIVDVIEDGLVVQGGDVRGCQLLTVREIAATARLWARLGRAPNPTELRQANMTAEHALFLAPLVRMLRSVPQLRIWAAAPLAPALSTMPVDAIAVEWFALELTEAAD